MNIAIIVRQPKSGFLSRANKVPIKVLIYLTCLMCLVTSVTGTLSISSFLNRFLMGCYLLLILALIILKGNTKYIVLSFSILALVAFDILITKQSIHSLNDLFYLPLWVLNLICYKLYYKDLKRGIVSSHKCFFYTAVIWNAITLLSLLSPSSFIVVNNVRSFVGACGQPHRFAATAIFALISVYIEFCHSRKKQVFILALLPILSSYLCGARTYLIVAAFFALFVLLKHFIKKRHRKFFLIVGICLAALLAFYVTLLRQKNLSSYSYQIENYGYLHFLTSGRSTFWEIDLREFFKEPFMKLLLGCGYNFVYDTNLEFYNIALWAHNDYINVLLANGFLGLFFYIYCFVSFAAKAYKKGGRHKLFLAMFVFAIFFNAMFNMVYTYMIASLLTPMLGIVLLDYDAKAIRAKDSLLLYIKKALNLIVFEQEKC